MPTDAPNTPSAPDGDQTFGRKQPDGRGDGHDDDDDGDEGGEKRTHLKIRMFPFGAPGAGCR